MGRRLPDQVLILALIAALALVHGCKEMEKYQLEKEAPALAHADFKVDRIAIAGVVSDVAALGDSAESRELVFAGRGSPRPGSVRQAPHRVVQRGAGDSRTGRPRRHARLLQGRRRV